MSRETPTASARAVLWDIDGTLIDSADYHWLTWRETMAREGIELTREVFDSTFGQRNDAVLRVFYGRPVEPEEAARVAEAKEHLYREMVRERGIEPLPGVRLWLERLKAGGWRQALASSAPPRNIEAIIAALGLAGFFDAAASAEDVERGKPAPDIFLAAAEKAGVNPARCVVIEDAPAGVAGARRAGMKCIGVLTTHPQLDADLVVHRLDELPAEAFDQLLGDQG